VVAVPWRTHPADRGPAHEVAQPDGRQQYYGDGQDEPEELYHARLRISIGVTGWFGWRATMAAGRNLATGCVRHPDPNASRAPRRGWVTGVSTLARTVSAGDVRSSNCPSCSWFACPTRHIRTPAGAKACGRRLSTSFQRSRNAKYHRC